MPFVNSLIADSEEVVTVGRFGYKVRAIGTKDLFEQGVAALVVTKGPRDGSAAKEQLQFKRAAEAKAVAELALEKATTDEDRARAQETLAAIDQEIADYISERMRKMGPAKTGEMVALRQASVCAGVVAGRELLNAAAIAKARSERARVGYFLDVAGQELAAAESDEDRAKALEVVQKLEAQEQPPIPDAEWGPWEEVRFVAKEGDEDAAASPPRLWVGRLTSETVFAIADRVEQLSTGGGREAIARFRRPA